MRFIDSTTAHARIQNYPFMFTVMDSLLKKQREGKTKLAVESYLKPQSTNLFDRIISMSGLVDIGDGKAVAGHKWVSSCVSNKELGLPRGQSVTVLNDGQTGLPLLIYDGSEISLARTAMFAMASIERLAPDEDSICLIGAGQVHSLQVEYLKQAYPKMEIFVYDIVPYRRMLFSERHGVKQITFFNEIFNHDILSVATAGSEDGWLKTAPLEKWARYGGLFINTSLRDIEDTAFKLFKHCVVDDLGTANQMGVPFYLALTKKGYVQNVHQLCNFTDPVLEPPVIVNPMGLAIWDVGFGYYLFQNEFNEEREKLMKSVQVPV